MVFYSTLSSRSIADLIRQVMFSKSITCLLALWLLHDNQKRGQNTERWAILSVT